MMKAFQPAMIDPFGRHITYLRVSVTDRCDFRCVYCMAERHDVPAASKDLLTLEELDRLCTRLHRQGRAQDEAHRRRAAGAQEYHVAGRALSRHLGAGLDELTLTTNGSQLARYAEELARQRRRAASMSRVDTLDAGEVQGDHALGRSRAR